MKHDTPRTRIIQRMRRVLLISCVGILVCLAAMSLFYTGRLRFNYPDREQYPVHGIDVSHHQQIIRWDQLPRDSFEFVFIKATEGGDFKDSRFRQNWEAAKHAGFVRGAYHFFTFCRPGAEQAANFIETVPVEPHTLPPVIDLEFGGNCKARPSRESTIHELRGFISGIEQTYQRPPILYVTYEAYERYIQGEFEGLDIWIRDIFWTPKLDRRPWRFWQYANRGRVRGISTYVDLNVFSGSREDFLRFIQQ